MQIRQWKGSRFRLLLSHSYLCFLGYCCTVLYIVNRSLWPKRLYHINLYLRTILRCCGVAGLCLLYRFFATDALVHSLFLLSSCNVINYEAYETTLHSFGWFSYFGHSALFILNNFQKISDNKPTFRSLYSQTVFMSHLFYTLKMFLWIDHLMAWP